MAVYEISEKDFDAEVDEGTTLVDFHATWCGPCKMMAPFLERFAADHPEIKVIKVDVDEAPNLCERFGLMSVPTLVLMKDGAFVKKAAGARDTDQLERFVMD